MRISVRPIARPAKLFVAPFVLLVAPRTTKTNMAVRTVSTMKPFRTSVGACRGAAGKLRGCADKGVKDGCGDDGTAYLTADIAYEIFARCASGNVCADGYGWIDMAA